MSLKKISITTGDVDGIGLEVAVKALLKIGPQKNTVFFLCRSDAPSKNIKKLDKKFERIQVENLEEGLRALKNVKLSRKILIDVAGKDQPPFWVQKSAELCNKKLLDGITTGPMSKTLIQSCGFKAMGHTEILAQAAGVTNIHMGFFGDKFNVVLATGHIPHKSVSENLTVENLKTTILQALEFTKLLGLSKRPIGLLGLNPHAGERGLIGNEENSVINNAIDWAKTQNIKLEGPLVPDAAFFQENWRKYSCYLACYHDQGLIPFKMVHGQDSGCHISLGLPFVRTSVDHGTAKDIFGKNKANPSSMTFALKFCLKLVQ
jgi:4-hydroxythreonine-4-phosphate dehydrogenase